MENQKKTFELKFLYWVLSLVGTLLTTAIIATATSIINLRSEVAVLKSKLEASEKGSTELKSEIWKHMEIHNEQFQKLNSDVSRLKGETRSYSPDRQRN